MAGSSDPQPILLDILIVGGGVAGLATAYRLQRDGHSVTVLEATDGTERGTGDLRCPPNMSRVLGSWGLNNFLHEKGTLIRSFEFFHAHTGERFGISALHRNFREELAAGYYFIRHCDLYEALLDLAVSSGATIRYNAKVTSVDPTIPQVTLASGETLSAQLLIGADGPHSLVRTSGTDANERLPKEKGDLRLLCMLDIPVERLLQDPDLEHFADPNGHESIIWLGRGLCIGLIALGSTFVLSFLVPFSKCAEETALWLRQPNARLEDYGIDISVFEPTVQKLVRIGENMTVAKYFSPTPTKNFLDTENAKVMVVGDAAHPLSPAATNNTALAIEDAEVLGTLLSKVLDQSQLKQMLVAFEEVRQPRSELMHTWDQAKPHMVTMPEEPEAIAEWETHVRTSFQESCGMDEDEAFLIRWGDEVDQYAYDSAEAAEDWWSKWGVLVNGRQRSQTVIQMCINTQETVETSADNNSLSVPVVNSTCTRESI